MLRVATTLERLEHTIDTPRFAFVDIDKSEWQTPEFSYLSPFTIEDNSIVQQEWKVRLQSATIGTLHQYRPKTWVKICFEA